PARTGGCEPARVLAHQQVEVALAVAGLDIGDAVERVGQRAADLGEELQFGHGQGRLPASRTAGPTRGADDVTQVEVDLLVADQLDATRAVDEVEERELPHLAPSHDAPGDSVLQLERLPRLGLL